MIMIYKGGMCKDCIRAELELREHGFGSDRIWQIRCIHEPACTRIEEMMNPKETK